jgi:beta-glucosidase
MVNVRNVGSRTGDEVIQLYIRDTVASVTRPVKELRGFSKVRLEPQGSAEVSFTIGPDELAFTKIDMEYGVEPGEFEILVGTSSRDQDLAATVLRVLGA